MKTFVFRGTPVTCARDIHDLLNAADQDLSLSKTRIGSNMLVNSRVHAAMQQQWIKLLPHVASENEVRYVGHSLGACHALEAPSFTPRSVIPHVFAFAPFQFANGPFWSATYAGRPQPKTYGRSKDFAPGWDHFDIHTVMACPITHLIGAGKSEIIPHWPILDECEGDHDVDRYVADLELVDGEQEAYAMCRLASAIYLTDVGDVIERFSGMGFKTEDVIEADGFRCAVLQPS